MDPRTAQTQAAIKAAFLKLIETMPFGKVSVSRLCDEVGIPRQTFYYHFNDWKSLVDSVIEDESDHFASLFASSSISLRQMTEQYLDHLDANRTFYLRLDEAGMRNILFIKLVDRARDAYLQAWRELTSGWTVTESELSFRFIAAGLFEVVFDYSEEITKEDRLDFIVTLIETHSRIARS